MNGLMGKLLLLTQLLIVKLSVPVYQQPKSEAVICAYSPKKVFVLTEDFLCLECFRAATISKSLHVCTRQDVS